MSSKKHLIHPPLDVTDDNLKLKLLRLLILFLPQSHFAVFYYLTDFLSKVSMNSESNSMSSANLAVCIGPSLLRKSISTGESQSSFLSQDPTVPSSSSMNSFVSASGNTLDVVADGHALTRRKSLFKSQKNSIVEGKSGALEFVGHSGEATKMTKQELQTNTAIVDLISFCIDHQHELWMVRTRDVGS